MRLVLVLAQDGGWGHVRGWNGGWMWLWGSLMMLTWVIVITTAVWLILRASRANDNSRLAREILDERFAKGELTEQEYRERRHALR